MLGFVAMAPAQAQQAPAPATAEVAVPAGPLDAGLKLLSQQLGAQLIYAQPIVAGRATQGVSGRLSLEQAVAQLLGGTGLTFRVVGPRTIQIDTPIVGQDGEHVLGAVRIEGVQDDAAGYVPATRSEGIAQLGGVRGRQDLEADGYRPRVASVGTGTPVALEDVPRSVSVVTSEQLQKQDVTTISEVLQRLPGVTVTDTQNGASTAPSITVRGYGLTQYQVDGGAPRTFSTGGDLALNLDTVDRVELIRGPNALFTGADSPGGSLNLVRKRPGAADAQSITIDAGTYGRVSGVADISTAGLLGSPISFRAIASVRREGSFVEDYNTTRTALYGIFDAPLGDNARIEAGVDYTNVDQHGENNGAIRDVNGGLIDLGRGYSYSSGLGAYYKNQSTEIFSKLYVNFAESWNFEFGGFHRSSTSSFKNVNASLANIRPDGSFIYPGSLYITEVGPSPATQLGISSKLTGRFKTFGLTHDVFGMLSYDRTDASAPSYNRTIGTAQITSLASLLAPTFDGIVTDQTSSYTGVALISTGIVLGDTISWRDIVSLSATVRRDDYNQTISAVDEYEGDVQDIRPQAPNYAGTWRPSFALSVKPTKRLTFYGSYADGFTRQDTSFARSGTAGNYVYTALAPSPYKNKEIGVKYGAARWLASLSLFDLRQTGAAVPVVGLFACPATLGGTLLNAQCYGTSASSTSRGIDFDFNGQIAQGLSVVASANYNKTKQLQATDPNATPLISAAPQTTASIFVDWTPGFLTAASIQVGGRYRSRTYNTGSLTIFDADGNFVGTQPFTAAQNAYVVADVGVDYRFGKGLTGRVFVENVTDKTYLTSVQVGQGNFYGRPRTFMASLTWRNAGEIPADGRSPTTGLAPFGDPSDWYAAFDSGYNVAGDLDAKASGKAQDGTSPVQWKFDTKNAPAFAVRVGRYFGDALRGEIEAKYRGADFGSIGGNAVAPYGVCGAEGSAQGVPFNCDDVPGKIDTWSLMANVLYDFGARDAVIRPFVGIGAGASRNSVSFSGKLDGIGGSTPWQSVYSYGTFEDYDRKLQEAIVSASTTTALTWQAIAGASLRLSSRLTLDATYRFVQVRNVTFSSYNLDQATPYSSTGDLLEPLTPRIGTFKADYNSHMVSLGLRWAFGQR